MTRVCHISPVHPLHDNRILYKEVRSVKEAGYDTHLVIQHDADEEIDGVQVHALTKQTSRVRRVLCSSWQAMFKALKTKSQLYHFHDLEFVPQALIMRMLGKNVIYDIHEDTVTSLAQKRYIPKPIRQLVALTVGGIEKAAAGAMGQIIAERCYESRFPSATMVLNYPKHVEHPVGRRSDKDLIYTGNVTDDRGAVHHASIPGLVDNVHMHFIGRCPTVTRDRLQSLNEGHTDRLHFSRPDFFVPHAEIVKQYRDGQWLAGLAIFPDTINYKPKELTKLFEYMLYGIPIIASRFPAWVNIVEKTECGICVDPESPDEIAAAVTRLRDDADLWQRMSDNGIRAAKQFTWASQSDNLLELYDSMLGRAKSGG